MDRTANLLVSIRNAAAVNHASLTVPTAKFSLAILAILSEAGFIGSFEATDAGTVIMLPGTRSIERVRRLSKLGRRFYVSHSEIPTVRNGRGLVIVSTSKGLMTGSQARKANVGGELVCEVY